MDFARWGRGRCGHIHSVCCPCLYAVAIWVAESWLCFEAQQLQKSVKYHHTVHGRKLCRQLYWCEVLGVGNTDYKLSCHGGPGD